MLMLRCGKKYLLFLDEKWMDTNFISTSRTVVKHLIISVLLSMLQRYLLLSDKYIEWFESLYYQPDYNLTKNESWDSARLEHKFAVSAPTIGGANEKVFTADEYFHGHLDWYNLDINPSVGQLDSTLDSDNAFETATYNFLPAPITFPGMPDTRWWAFEDGKTDLGGIKPNTTDINKLILMDFALIYANDWLMYPLTIDTGTVTEIKGLVITNVFGEKTWVEAAGKGQDENWQRWSMYNMNIQGNDIVPAEISLMLLPALPKLLQGKPLEKVFLFRDEVANMVWGVETKVPLLTGKSVSGREAALDVSNYFGEENDDESPTENISDNEAKIQYKLMNNVPLNWIPFVPARKPNDQTHRHIQLQRGAMPRIQRDGDGNTTYEKVEPRTSILRVGLDESEPKPYFIHEEEVPRSGIKVQLAYQRTRGINGQVYTWLGIQKQTGKGEGHSGLAFDRIVPKD